jgi:hypothetical protein
LLTLANVTGAAAYTMERTPGGLRRPQPRPWWFTVCEGAPRSNTAAGAREVGRPRPPAQR